MSNCTPMLDGGWLICQTHVSTMFDGDDVCHRARFQAAEAQVKAVRDVCEQQVKDRSLYSADRDKYGIDRIDGWNDALDIVEQALDGAK